MLNYCITLTNIPYKVHIVETGKMRCFYEKILCLNFEYATELYWESAFMVVLNVNQD